VNLTVFIPDMIPYGVYRNLIPVLQYATERKEFKWIFLKPDF